MHIIILSLLPRARIQYREPSLSVTSSQRMIDLIMECKIQDAILYRLSPYDRNILSAKQ